MEEYNINNTLNKAKNFFSKHKIVTSNPKIVKNKTVLEFELNLKSYVTKDNTANSFIFELTLKTYRNGFIDFLISSKKKSFTPFHPHFHRKGLWKNYKSKRGDIEEFIKGMILSLQFQEEYVCPEYSDIGNRRARDWYTRQLIDSPNKFPTDNKYLGSDYNNQREKQKEDIPPDKIEAKLENTESTVKKRFTITQNKSYTLREKRFPRKDLCIVDGRLNSNMDSLESDTNSDLRSLLFLGQKAKNQIWEHIRWGHYDSFENKNEQGGILIGRVYQDNVDKLIYGIVEQVVTANSAEGHPAYLKMTHESWSQMLDDADKIIDEDANSELQIIGWYHTHPNNLGVFMSATDLNTQRQFFNQNWHYAVVINPHKMIWKAFIGPEAKECQGFVLKKEVVAAKNKEINHDSTIDKEGGT